MGPTADDLDGYTDVTVYEDGTVVRISVRRTTDDAYPSGWRYTFHYGALTAGPETLDDGTIRRTTTPMRRRKATSVTSRPTRNRSS